MTRDEIQKARELLEQVNQEGFVLGFVSGMRELMPKALDRIEELEHEGTHSCHIRCKRLECVQRRRIDRLEKALEFYADEERILGGSDYQFYGTSSWRQAKDDGGKRARQALADFDKETKGTDT